MLRRPFCGMAAGFILGILAAVYGEKRLLWVAAGILAAAAAGFFFRQQISADGSAKKAASGVARILLILVMLFLGCHRYEENQEFRQGYLPFLENHTQITVCGRLSSKEYKKDHYIYYLTSCMAGINPGRKQDANQCFVPCSRILINSDSDQASIGETLIINGTVELWRTAVNEGNFDEKAFYEAQKTDFKLTDIRILSSDGKKDRLRETLYGLRRRILSVYEKVLDAEDGGVLGTMVLGDKSLLGPELKKAYQTAGISHILAISGLHISVIGMSLYRLLRKLGAGFFPAGAAAGGIVFCYGTMAGMGTSVQRAVFMFFLLILGNAVGRSYDSLNALGAAAVFLLWRNPYLLFYAGFLFSFAAVFGVVFVGGSMAKKERTKVGETEGRSNKEGEAGDREKGWNGKKREKHLEALSVGMCIQLATLPLAAWYYYEIPVYAVFVNLLVLPFVSAVLILGAAGGLAGLVSVKAAHVILFPCHMILTGYQKLCLVSAALPGALFVTGRPKLWKMAVYYTALFLLTRHRYHGKRKPGRFVFLFAGIGLLLFLFWAPEKGFELDVLDVGQGDGIFLQTEDGYRLFIDGGSSDVKKVGEYRMLPFLKSKGIRRIDYWFISHTDKDHISGVQEVLEAGYPVDYLVFSKEIEKEKAYKELVRLAEKNRTRILQLAWGSTLHLGTADIRAVFPKAPKNDKNAASLVLFYEEGAFSGIFTGDIGTSEEKEILALGAAEEVDFYKAAHHGSKGSNSAEFLSYLHPTVSVVSCGLNNRYGHPGREALEHMEEAGSEVFYTMYAGQLKLTVDKEALTVQKYTDLLDVSRFPVVR